MLEYIYGGIMSKNQQTPLWRVTVELSRSYYESRVLVLTNFGPQRGLKETSTRFLLYWTVRAIQALLKSYFGLKTGQNGVDMGQNSAYSSKCITIEVGMLQNGQNGSQQDHKCQKGSKMGFQ